MFILGNFILILFIQGLFALASMPSHSCVANATHDFSTRESGYRMTMRAVDRIKKGAEITHSYTEPLDPVLLRRTLLQVSSITVTCHCKKNYALVFTGGEVLSMRLRSVR